MSPQTRWKAADAKECPFSPGLVQQITKSRTLSGGINAYRAVCNIEALNAQAMKGLGSTIKGHDGADLAKLLPIWIPSVIVDSLDMLSDLVSNYSRRRSVKHSQKKVQAPSPGISYTVCSTSQWLTHPDTVQPVLPPVPGPTSNEPSSSNSTKPTVHTTTPLAEPKLVLDPVVIDLTTASDDTSTAASKPSDGSIPVIDLVSSDSDDGEVVDDVTMFKLVPSGSNIPVISLDSSDSDSDSDV
jgi:hypothetical protein